MMACRREPGTDSAGRKRKKLSKFCGIIALGIAQNKKHTFFFRQAAERAPEKGQNQPGVQKKAEGPQKQL